MTSGRAYSKKHDAFFHVKGNRWIEGVCRDKECEFCKDRPWQPSMSEPVKYLANHNAKEVKKKDENFIVTVNHLEAQTIRDMQSGDPHHIDGIVRRNGQNFSHEADFIKRMKKVTEIPRK